jgi:hypothetical protein
MTLVRLIPKFNLAIDETRQYNITTDVILRR